MEDKMNIHEQIAFEGGDEMLSREELERLKCLDLEDVDVDELKELSEVRLFSDLPVQERLELFLYQIGNPYCFKVGGTPVQVSFSSGRKTLDEALNNYLTNLKDCDRI